MKKIIKYMDKPLFVITTLLFLMGLIMIFSASNVTAYMSLDTSPYNYFIKQGRFGWNYYHRRYRKNLW